MISAGQIINHGPKDEILPQLLGTSSAVNMCEMCIRDRINHDASIDNKLKVVFIEDYKVSNAEWIFAAADVSEQISTCLLYTSRCV